MSKGSEPAWVPWEGPTKGTVKRGPHQMTKRILHWPYCSRCGLMALKNDASRAALKRECVTEE